jgi:opacity protein-like surface antigen
MKIKAGGDGIQAVAFAGYKMLVGDTFHASVQADLGYDTLKSEFLTTDVASAFSYTLKTDISYGASVRAGMVYDTANTYLIGGLRIAKWKVIDQYNTSAIVQADATTVSKSLVTPELGFGVEFNVSDSVSARKEYKYLMGKKQELKTESAASDIDYSIKVREQSVQVSLVF